MRDITRHSARSRFLLAILLAVSLLAVVPTSASSASGVPMLDGMLFRVGAPQTLGGKLGSCFFNYTSHGDIYWWQDITPTELLRNPSSGLSLGIGSASVQESRIENRTGLLQRLVMEFWVSPAGGTPQLVTVHTAMLPPYQGKTWQDLCAAPRHVDGTYPAIAVPSNSSKSPTDPDSCIRQEPSGSFLVAIGSCDFSYRTDSTPPSIIATVSGTPGKAGWYRSAVSVSWNVTDGESSVTSMQGCEPVQLSSDTKSTTLTCSAASAGGTASKSVTLKIDKTPPTLACKSARFVFSQFGARVYATVRDATSGPVATPVSRAVGTTQPATSTRTDPPFSGKVKLTASDKAGNTASATCAYAVESYSWATAKTLTASTYDWGFRPCPTSSPSCMRLTYLYSGVTYGQADPWIYYFRNCTSYVAWRLKKAGASKFGGLGNGGLWYERAPNNGLKRGTSPKKGAAAVILGTKSHPFGHVAYVEAVHSDGTITVTEYNYGTSGKWGKRRGKASALGFTRFVYFG